MELSNELISQFAKAVAKQPPTDTETTLYGTVVIGDTTYVRLDGSDLLTPVQTTTDVQNDERVTVMIKDHNAIITGNTSSPSARTDDVKDLKGEVVRVYSLVADKVSTEELDAQIGRIDYLVSDNVVIKDKLTASEAAIDTITADNVTIHQRLTVTEADIKVLDAEKVSADFVDATYAKIVDLEATDAYVHNLEVDYGDFKNLTTGNFTAVNANIANLEATKLSATDADLKYANIDFSNIGKAAIEEFFSKSGMIQDLVVGDGVITGELVGVTIKGDLIEGGTVIADKLVVKGENGLYYKLNVDGESVETEQTEHNSLNGSVITAKSITASKISVNDLVAFDATIGGFKITDNSLYSGIKESVHNTTRGLYMDDDGQLSFGDTSNFLKYYKDENGDYSLEISAKSITMVSRGGTVDDALDNIQESADEAQATANTTEARLVTAETMIKQLNDVIAMLVTDENGTSLMTQTSDGWTFNIGSISNAIANTANTVGSMSNALGGMSNNVANMNNLVDDLGRKTAYITLTTDDNGNPCIELGKEGDEFRVRITNIAVDFMAGTSKIAYVSNNALYIKRAIIKEELQIGEDSGFVWKRRANGNLGLRWIGGS